MPLPAMGHATDRRRPTYRQNRRTFRCALVRATTPETADAVEQPQDPTAGDASTSQESVSYGIQRGDTFTPRMGAGHDAWQIHVDQLTRCELALAGDPHIRHLMAAGRVNQLRHNVEQGLGFQVAQPYGRQIR